MKAKDIHNSLAVNEHIQKYDESLRDIINKLRQNILTVDQLIGEQIKWNSPSFFYTGPMREFDAKEYKRDIAVLNLHRGSILIVLPTGAKIEDNTGILEGNYPDGRRLIKIADMADLKNKEASIKQVISEWLKLIDR